MHRINDLQIFARGLRQLSRRTALAVVGLIAQLTTLKAKRLELICGSVVSQTMGPLSLAGLSAKLLPV